ncbi:Hypothetical protein PBC10988_18240 [Planctomycetales bacterium 10988]|nr:Hypothetical protein PBC10988_18240 [Planctomycetales bacterium 10988]
MQLGIPHRTDLVLRPFPEAVEASLLYAFVEKNREHLCTGIPEFESVQSVEFAQQLLQFLEENMQEQTDWHYAIYHQEEFVGYVGLNEIDWTKREAELAYWIAEEAQGKGIATDAASRLLTYGVDHLDLRSIHAECELKNPRSYRVLERLQFQWLHTRLVPHGDDFQSGAIGYFEWK